jgi:hypothetical protein
MFEVSSDFLQLGWLRTGLELSQECLPGDRLRASLSVLVFATGGANKRI